MHNLIPAPRSYFLQSAFASQQAAMCTTLRAENIGRNWAHGVGQAVAGEINSATNGDASVEAIPVLARLAIKDLELDGEKRFIAWARRLRFVARFFKQSFGDIVGKIECGFRVCGHSVSIVLVECNRASVAQTPQPVNRQTSLYAIDMPIAGVFERASRQIRRFVAQGHIYIDLFVHGGIVGCLKRKFHSFFPVVDFVHVQIVGRATQQRNAEISRSST